MTEFLKILGLVAVISIYLFLWAAFMASGIWYVGIPVFIFGFSVFVWLGKRTDWWI